MRLVLDSSGPYLLAGLHDGTRTVAEVQEPGRPPEGRDIGRVVAELLAEAGNPELDDIVVGLGPGSFIGSRVAISYANGLAGASGLPLIGVNSLAGLLRARAGAGRVIRDARRGQWYLYQLAERSNCECLSLEQLGQALEAEHEGALTLEQPAGGEAGGLPKGFAVLHALLEEQGLDVQLVTGPDCAGLVHAAQGVAPGASGYLEPIYLRGYL